MIPEFSRPIAVDSLPALGRTWTIEASPDECALLAQRFGIPQVSSVKATVKAKPLSHGDVVRVTGALTAVVVQACVVTLAPVTQTVQEDFDVSFSPSVENQDGDLDIDLASDDPPDPFFDGQIDIGEVVAEHLALGLDPFPRAGDAKFDDESTDCVPEPEMTQSPFAVLGDLIKKKL